ncbi:MAG: symmetrical bis(5'-nucleosyl)-tetraphosphatase [Gammaproteobacteria bacterium]|nr:MAG: symmetrical bis(5'-nucleosyl)-tetraphosphatase [Gammaproteobacteria bacterium]
MTTWIVGDIQGCDASFAALLSEIGFEPGRDDLWLAGDLINRGPDSLGVMRRVLSLGESVNAVLGNHDLHFLAVALGARKLKRKDTFGDILAAPERDRIIDWLRERPMLHTFDERQVVLAHAGLPFMWTVETARMRASALEATLRGSHAAAFLKAMYGDLLCHDYEAASEQEYQIVTTNYLTRMRFLDAEGRMDFTAKETVEQAPPGFRPWFEYPRPDTWTLVFGHWAALEGHTGLPRFVATDTGCVWGGSLTAWCLETGERVSVPAQEKPAWN